MSPTNSPNPIPFSEPPYLRNLPSPYYTEGHLRFQKACRAFLWENLISHAAEWEKEGHVPEHVFETFCKHNMLLPNLPAPLPVDWLKRLGIHDILGVRVEDWDYLYTGIYCDEVCSLSSLLFFLFDCFMLLYVWRIYFLPLQGTLNYLFYEYNKY